MTAVRRLARALCLAAAWAICPGSAAVAQAPAETAQRPLGDLATRVVRLPPLNTAPTRRYDAIQATAVMPDDDAEPEPIPHGQEVSTPGTTLEELAGVAIANSPAVRAAAAQASAARALAYQASLYPNPTVGTASPQLAGNQTQYNTYIIQDVVTKGKIRLDTSAADRVARQAELAWVRAQFDVLTIVRQRFYTALAAQQRVEVLRQMVEIARKSLDIQQRMLRNEVGSKGDVLFLQIDASRAEAELQNARTLLESNKRQLAAATGVIELDFDRLAGDLKQALPNYELTATQQSVLARNASVRSAEIEIGRSEILLRRAEVEPFPNLNMMGGYQNQLPGAQAPENQAMYQVQMIVPLWNRNQGNIRAAQAGIGAATAHLQRVRTELANTTAAAVGRYLTAVQLTQRYERTILPSAVELQAISSQLYTNGHIPFLQFLVAQRSLLDANLSYISAQEGRWTSAAEIAGLLQSEQFP